jgi:hypothetical protein
VTLPPLPSRRAAVRDDSGPAGDIEHALTRLQCGDLDEIIGPRSKNTRDEIALVILRHASDELPTRLGIHLAPPMSGCDQLEYL